VPAWTDDEIVLISAIEHYSYCPRQCALIHVEQVFDDNALTLQGSHGHERAHEPLSIQEEGKRTERALPLWSDRLGLSGVADAVEFHDDGAVVPVEYKHGKRRGGRHDALQLCAQAMCLEEMLGVTVTRAAVFRQQARRRKEIAIDDQLRRDTVEIIGRVRAMLRSGTLPPPLNNARCRDCSLADACVPDVLETARHTATEHDLYHASEEGPSP
jgi:CRISPR-associated exonuclease Cas4